MYKECSLKVSYNQCLIFQEQQKNIMRLRFSKKKGKKCSFGVYINNYYIPCYIIYTLCSTQCVHTMFEYLLYETLLQDLYRFINLWF